MSISTCVKCGGHIPLGHDASNRCEKCGLGLFDAHVDPLGTLRARVAELEQSKIRVVEDRDQIEATLYDVIQERDRYREALEKIVVTDTADLQVFQNIAAKALTR